MSKRYKTVVYDDVLQISIAKLKEWGYLAQGQIKYGRINWSSNGNPTGNISIQVNTNTGPSYIELSYKYENELRKYKVYLTSTPSNLGKGEIWYFLCPHTKKRCRKLYLIGGYFLHREAFKGCMYECQTLSKDSREWRQALNLIFKREDLLNILHAKHFKSTYAGKPTKRYLKIMHLIQDIENRRS